MMSKGNMYDYIYIYGIWQTPLFQSDLQKSFDVSINKHILLLFHKVGE